ncbi:polyisoprenoid-binding protein [Amylibacter marinus]|uniref:Polyisoprenoid-binding protein n=1 Tax=Amylibacter marinus TaxID=1475483 RepID=A0ABQ5VSZ8_9RHOB|nr:YceI family protein [Amylibacter marinus]GLQ34243.1 polyisoprenoid-binding protein [Amylibacter marinus]
MNFLSKSALAAILISASTMATAKERYLVHEDHTWVTFSVNHAGWANARGMFRTVSGEINFDQEDVTQSSVSVILEAASLDTNSKQRDRDMAGADFLNSIEFPQITFDSTRIEKTGERTGIVYGDMSMVGVTREVALDVTWNAEFALPWDPSTIKTGFSATTQIDGTDFGINSLVDFGLGPKINVVIDLEAIRQN